MQSRKVGTGRMNRKKSKCHVNFHRLYSFYQKIKMRMAQTTHKLALSGSLSKAEASQPGWKDPFLFVPH